MLLFCINLTGFLVPVATVLQMRILNTHCAQKIMDSIEVTESLLSCEIAIIQWACSAMRFCESMKFRDINTIINEHNKLAESKRKYTSTSYKEHRLKMSLCMFSLICEYHSKVTNTRETKIPRIHSPFDDFFHWGKQRLLSILSEQNQPSHVSLFPWYGLHV